MALKLRSPIVFQTPAVNPAVTRRVIRGELGAPGQIISGGTLRTTDYNVDLQPPAIYDIYDRMRKSDGTVKGLMSAIKLPLLNVDWRIKPATESKQDTDIANWLEYKLFKMMSTSFDSLLYQILLYLDYGSMPFEIVWDLDNDGLIYVRKLAPRLPKTVTHWNVDEYGGLRSITQIAYKASIATPIEIPIEKLLVFINDQEGSDFRGTSLLRSCYKHWYMKERFYIIDAIAKERRAIGIDVGTMKGSDITDDDQSDLQSALMGLHAHEKQFFIEQEEKFTYRVEGIAGRPLPVLDSVEHHDKLILRSLLAEFIGLGGGGGSYAMSRDKSSFFTMALNSIAKYIGNVFSRYLIPKWVDYNWTVDKYPILVHSRIETRDVDALSRAIQNLSTSGFVNPISADEDSLRDILELPPVTREQEVTGIALNGTQLSAITTLFQRVGEGLISREQTPAILKASFPFLSDEQINSMCGI